MPLVWTLLLNVPLGVAVWWVARFGFRQPSGLPRLLAAVVLAWAWATLGMEVLGEAGFLRRGPLLGWVLLGLAVAVALRWRRRGENEPGETVALSDPWPWDATMAVGLIVWASLILGVRSLVGPVKVVSDGPIYHLYFAARWWKAGRLFLVATPFGESAAAYFSAVGDLWFTWLMIGWGGDRLAKIGQAPFLLAAALSAFGMARRLGAGVGASAIAVAWFVGATPVILFNFEANVDSILVAGYLLAAFFFLRYALGDGGFGTLAIGGLAAGGALGTKPTGVVFVPVLLAMAGLTVLVRERSIRCRVRALLVLATTPMVMAGYWYGRNALLTGNPLYPLQVEAMGRVILPGWYGSDVMRLSPYYLPMDDLRAFGEILIAVLDPRQAPVWILALAGAWAWGRSRPALGRWVAGFSALAILNLALYWILIPYRTQQRFMFPAIGLAVVPLARTFDRGRWLRVLGVAMLAAHLLTPPTWPFLPDDQSPPWDLSSKVPNVISSLIFVPYNPSILRAVRTDPGALSQTLASLGFGLGAMAIAWAWGRGRLPFLGRARLRPSRSAGLIDAARPEPRPPEEDQSLGASHHSLSPPCEGGVGGGASGVSGPKKATPPNPPFARGGGLLDTPRRERLWWRARAIGVSLGVVGLALVLTIPREADPRLLFFPSFPEYIRGWLHLDLHVGRDGARIAYAGTNLPYYLLGPGLRNEVRSINVDAHRGWLLHDYHREARSRGEGNWPTPYPGWDRAHPDFSAWLANLRAEGIQLLVVARVPFDGGAHTVADPQGFPIERQWAESHPETFEPLYGVRENDSQFRIYRVLPSHLPPRS